MYLALFVVLLMARAASLDLVCGTYHNCVFERGQEAMKCWGLNVDGQLGYDDTNNRGDEANEMGANLTFVHIGTGFVVEDMQLGYRHSCAKSVDRAMKCFGSNAESQLGFDGVTTTGDALPFLVFGADFNLSKIAVGSRHTCALSTDAALKCFGDNYYGQCGAGSTINPISGPPSQISAVDLGTDFTAVDVQTFGGYVCVKSQQGTAKCFGHNGDGQLGYGDTTQRGKTPASMGDGLPIVDLGSNFIVAAAISTGGLHSCALSTTKTVKCWGYNAYGQCGTQYSTETGDDLPVLQFGSDFVPMQLALGYWHTCILSENAALICFGHNSNGQLGIGTNTNSVGTPSTLTGIDLGTGFVPRRVAAGHYHNCAVSTTDTVKCWGNNADGQLGLGHTNNMGDDANEMGDNLPFVNVCLNCTAAATTDEPTTPAPTTARPTSAAPTTAEPTTATATTASPTTTAPTTAAPTTASPTTLTTEVTARPSTESETTDAATATPTSAYNNSHSNHTVTVTIRSNSLSSTQILIAIASAHNLSSTPLILTTLSSGDSYGDDGFATVELLVAVPSNVELDYDVIKATLKEAMVDEYGEDIQVDIDVHGDKDESDETPQPAGTTKLFGLHWLVVVALCIAIVCCGGTVVAAIRCVRGKQHRQPQRDDVDDRQHAQQIEMPVHRLPAVPNIHAIDSQSDIEEKRDASDIQVQPGAGGPDLASTHESSMSNRSEGLRASIVAASTAGLVDEHHVQAIQTQGLEEDEFEIVDDEVAAGHE